MKVAMAPPGPRFFAACTCPASSGTATVALLAVVASVAVLKTVGPARSGSGLIASRMESASSKLDEDAAVECDSPLRNAAADGKVRTSAGACATSGTGTGAGAG